MCAAEDYWMTRETGGIRMDDGTMGENVRRLGEFVIGRRIVSVDVGTIGPSAISNSSVRTSGGLVLTLDNGARIALVDVSDGYAYTSYASYPILNLEYAQQPITGIEVADFYRRWNLNSELGTVLTISVDWSPCDCGDNPEHGYGFLITEVTLDPTRHEVFSSGYYVIAGAD